MKRRWLALCGSVLVASCSSTLKDYQGSTPDFDLEEYFNGHLVAYGMVQSRSGKLTRNFCAEITGTWQGSGSEKRGELDETFYFNDGEITHRLWTLTPAADGTFTGTAGDVIGTATGQTVGRAFNMHYVLELPVKDKDGKTTVYELSVDDWMYRMDDVHVFNRSTLSKFGFDVAEVTLFFTKGQRHCAAAGNAAVPSAH